VAVVQTEHVVDASAALAFLLGETGGDVVAPCLPGGLISAVNLAEVAQRCWRLGHDPTPYVDRLTGAGLRVVAADMLAARLAADLERLTRPYGLSLADRFCLALALDRSLPVLTSDRPFQQLGLPISIILIR
jgi:PIN domain nuclease of toxin-antitoxin system